MGNLLREVQLTPAPKPGQASPVCSCGGPGGRPGMTPICLSCYKSSKSITAAIARQDGRYFTERGDADRAKLLGV